MTRLNASLLDRDATPSAALATAPTPPMPPTPQRPRSGRILARRLTSDGTIEWVVVQLDEILYGFRPEALRAGAIEAPWTDSSHIRGRKVHLRTRTGLVKTNWNSLKDALAHLSALPVQRTYHGCFINLKTFDAPDLVGRRKRVGFRFGRETRDARTEWVRVSRRAAREIPIQLLDD